MVSGEREFVGEVIDVEADWDGCGVVMDGFVVDALLLEVDTLVDILREEKQSMYFASDE